MSFREFLEWGYYYRLEPFGEPWARSAMIGSILANQWRDSDTDPIMPRDLMPGRKKPKPMSDAQLRKAMRRWYEITNSGTR
jgi:hypothetical protein